MIEQILKKKKSTFLYGEVISIDSVNQRVQIKAGEIIVWISTTLNLSLGDMVILAQDENKQKFIVQAAANVRPAVNILLLV